eukprot:2405304-Pleurochrysis_carterae.AAC.1
MITGSVGQASIVPPQCMNHRYCTLRSRSGDSHRTKVGRCPSLLLLRLEKRSHTSSIQCQ